MYRHKRKRKRNCACVFSCASHRLLANRLRTHPSHILHTLRVPFEQINGVIQIQIKRTIKMKTLPNYGLTTKLFTLVGIAALLVVALAIGGWFITTAFAQGPWQGGFMGIGYNNQVVLTLLKTNESDLLKERQASTSWLDIATAKGVSEQALTDALLQPMMQMQTWMTQNYPQFNATQMTEWMRQQIAQDIRVSQYGTMIDIDNFGGSMMSEMMGNGNSNKGFGGMMNGNGMMGGGMMGGGM